MVLKKLVQSVKASMDVSAVVIDVVLIVALIPVVATMVSSAQTYVCNNASYPTLVGGVCSNGTANISATALLSTSELLLLGLTSLFIVLGLIFMIGRQTGLIKK